MMFLATPAGVVPYEPDSVYYLLGRHIIGIAEGETTSVYNAGRADAPTPGSVDPWSPALQYHQFNGPVRGATVGENPSRLGVWSEDHLEVIQFVDPSADELVVDSTETYAYVDTLDFPMVSDIFEIRDGRGRAFFEFYGQARITEFDYQFAISAISAGGRADLITHTQQDTLAYGAYDGLITVPYFPE